MKKILKIIIMMIFSLLMITAFSQVKAASASISTNKKSVSVGETSTISVTINAAAWNVSVSGVVNDHYAGNTEDANNTTMTKTLNFTPSVVGSYSVNITGDISDGTTNATTTVSGSVTITATNPQNPTTGNNSGSQTPNNPTPAAPAAKSSVATLSNLGIKPNDFSGFSASKTSYTVSVPNATATVEVYASKGQNGQTISGTGNKTLNEGDNSFSINVTAEDGTTKKTYTLNVHRKTVEEEQAEGKTEENTEEQKLGLSELQIEGITLSPSFTTDIYEYSTTYIGQNTKFNITTKANNEEATVEVIGNENLVEGDNLINIIVKDKTGENTTTYQLTINKSLEDTKAIEKQKEEQLQQEKTKKYIIVGSVIAVILIIIIILIIIKRHNRKLEEEYGISYSELQDDEDEQENNMEQDNYESSEEYDEIEEEKIKKKKSKGKRFK